MYRISYTVTITIPGFCTAGDRRELLYTTNEVFNSFRRWQNFQYATDVTLESYADGVWTTIEMKGLKS